MENNKMLNQKINFFYFLIVTIFWLLFTLFPFFLAQYLSVGNENSNLPEYIAFYSIFISPIFFFIPYKLSVKYLKNKKEKILFIVFGLVVPLILFYSFLVFEFYRTFSFGF